MLGEYGVLHLTDLVQSDVPHRLRNVTGYHIGCQQSTVLSAAFQKTYVTQKAPRSTPPLNPTVLGQNRKAYVERGALFTGWAASRVSGVPWAYRYPWWYQ